MAAMLSVYQILRARCDVPEIVENMVIETTKPLRDMLGCGEEEIELIALTVPGRYMAYSSRGFASHLPLNTRATSLFHSRFMGAHNIFGDAVLMEEIT